MKKILLINPAFKGSLHTNIKVLAIPPLNLAMIARYTPEHYEVEIVDEAVEDLNFDTRADLVGITCMTPLAPRAYEIAAEFKKRGVPVVMGGIHVSYMTEEALRYADTVVVGEAENLWPQVLQDFERGQMQKVYKVCEQPDIENLQAPRRDLFRGKYFVETVQTGRGCPINCNFCSVTAFNGPRYRTRNIDNVINEIHAMKSKRIFIVDDNIVGSGRKFVRRAKDFFDRLQECNKEWGGQTCLNIVEHDDVLKSAQRSGCKGFLIGFESLDAATINSMHKSVNLRANTRNFRDSIKKIHDHGIAIVGCFIFGADGQDKDTFRRTIDFVLENEIDAVQMTLETPLPGTAFYRQMVEENRLLLTNYPNDWKHYTIFEPVFRMKSMSPREAYENLLSAYAEVSSFKSSFVRGLKTFRNTRSLFSTGISFS
ncbi:MAG: B12-binding domain-containing radical SAM protein, partial [Gammaproteobacteria bacterium]|nr:B12-binding domain-containing radical SAM protein [Gammaproteobacteria bacterium]